MKIKYLLKKHDLYANDIKYWCIQLGINDYDVDDIIFRAIGMDSKDLSSEEKAKLLLELISMCDSNNPNFDFQVYRNMSAINYETNLYYPGHNHNKWNNGLFGDDGFGLGTEITSIRDDYIDSQSFDYDDGRAL